MFRVKTIATPPIVPTVMSDHDDLQVIARMLSEGRSISAIAETLGCTAGAVRLAIGRTPELQHHLASSMEVTRATVAFSALARAERMLDVLVDIAEDDGEKASDRIKAASKVLDVSGAASATQQRSEAELAGRQHVGIEAKSGLMDAIIEVVKAGAAGATEAALAAGAAMNRPPATVIEVVGVDSCPAEAPSVAPSPEARVEVGGEAPKQPEAAQPPSSNVPRTVAAPPPDVRSAKSVGETTNLLNILYPSLSKKPS